MYGKWYASFCSTPSNSYVPHPLHIRTALHHGQSGTQCANPDGSFADWHFDEVFLSGRGKIRVAGKDTQPTFDLLGSYGIRECSGVLRRFGVSVPTEEKIYAASHVRAILDMVLSSIAKHKQPDHVSALDLIDNDQDIAELKSKVQELKQKITDAIAVEMLNEWEAKHLFIPSPIAR